MRIPFATSFLAAFVAILPIHAAPPAKTAEAPAVVVPKSSVSPNEIVRAMENTFVGVYEKVSPAVVVISVTRASGSEAGNSEDAPDFFDFHKKRRSPMPFREPGESQGSGFIVRADGYIFTNNHVIQDAEKIKVKLKDGRTFDATVVGIPDERTDIAVLKIDAKNLPTVELGDSDAIRPGQWTIAIGAPFNLDYSFTSGPLSGKLRVLGATDFEEYLQTQATINPGNSGGPLLDIEGKVIGINTLIKTRQGTGFSYYNANVGFAIPIKLAQKIGHELITKGKVERPWIGVGIQSLADVKELKNRTKGVTQGVVINTISQGTPAHRAGLKPADVITSIDDVAVATARDLQKQVLDKQIGQIIHLKVVRQGKTLAINLKTGLQPSSNQLVVNVPRQQPPPETQSYGMTVQPITRELADQLQLQEKQGVLITEIEDDSPAARAGLQPGIVITEVDDRSITSPQGLKDSLMKSDPARGALIQYIKDGVQSFTVLVSPASSGKPETY
jgi:serine protease Do